jgi:hypothetical protein
MIQHHQQFLNHQAQIRRSRQALPAPSFYVGRDPATGFRYWVGVDGEVTAKRFVGDYQPSIGLDLQREVIGR